MAEPLEKTTSSTSRSNELLIATLILALFVALIVFVGAHTRNLEGA